MANNTQNNNRPNKPYQKRHKKAKVGNNYQPKGNSQLLAKTVESLDLKEKTLEIIKKGGVNTLNDLLKYRETELYRIQNFNKKNLLEVTAKIKSLNLSFRPDEKATPSNGPRQDRIKVYADGRIDDKIVKNANKKTKKEKKHGISLYDCSALVGAKIKYKPKPIKNEKLPKETLLVFNKNDKYGYKELQGKVVIPAQYDEAFSFKENLACVMKDDKYGFINKNNEIVIPFEYDLALSFSEGLACVTKGEKSGYIDKDNNVVINFDYDATTPFEEGYARVKIDDKWGIIDKNTKIRMV